MNVLPPLPGPDAYSDGILIVLQVALLIGADHANRFERLWDLPGRN
jgi:hypothetical protein